MMMNTNPNLEVLLNSEIYKDVVRQADAKRLEAHRAAVDVLLEHQTDTGKLDACIAATEKARKEFEPRQAAYNKALMVLIRAEVEQADTSRSHESISGRLRAEAVKHAPEILRRFDAALYQIPAVIRAAYTTRSHHEPLTLGGTRAVYADNLQQIEAATAQVEACRELIAELEVRPMPQDEVMAMLSAEATKLILLAKEAGALVAYYLPEELRGGALAEKLEREGRYIFPSW
jgi:hypothetical protein